MYDWVKVIAHNMVLVISLSRLTEFALLTLFFKCGLAERKGKCTHDAESMFPLCLWACSMWVCFAFLFVTACAGCHMFSASVVGLISGHSKWKVILSGVIKRAVVSCFYQIKSGLELKHVTQLSSSVYCAALLKGSDTGGQQSNFSFSVQAGHLSNKESAHTHYTNSSS